jgi:rfaE bifunctional protein nucleotidyltransferase chain/domain/rfaE bifunctional protein kinase chain/domain
VSSDHARVDPARRNPVRVVVIGDALLDVDVDGEATRLAPDAPVPVVTDVEVSVRPGGAALAAAFVAAAEGVEVALVTGLGRDRAGRRLTSVVGQFGIEVYDVGCGGDTPQKIRVRAGSQSVTRIDVDAGGPELGTDVAEHVSGVVAQADAVLVADYGRGVAALPPIRRALAARADACTVWDPHPRGPEPVAGAQLVTPNELEARRLVPGMRAPSFPAAVAEAAGMLRTRWRARAVAVTCGARGAVLAGGDAVPLVVPVETPTLGDACGAGDRFSATAVVTLARGALPSEAVVAAVEAASRYVADGGPRMYSRPLATTRPTAPETVVATSGCFDLLHAGHVSALRAARALGDRLVVYLNSDASVRRLKGPGRPLVPAADRAAVLRSLECVDDVVIFDEDTPIAVLERLHPAVFAKGGDYDATTLPEAEVLARWGGRTVVVPYLEGRSTTRIVKEARHAGT